MQRMISTFLTVSLTIGAATTTSRAGVITRCHGDQSTIVGTTGDDTIDGTSGNDVIAGLGGNDVIQGFGGDDVICGGPGSDNLLGGSGNDVLRCGGGHDGGADGGAGNDELYGEADGRNDLYPGPGDDLVVGSSTGPDWLHLGDAPGPIHASLMTGAATGQGTDSLVDIDSLYGSAFDDTLIGSNGDDGLVGREGIDTLIGHAGVDFFSGQAGNDIYRGGPGFDIAEYYDQNIADERTWGPMIVNLRTGVATGDGTDTLISIEGASGSDEPDTMIGDAKSNSFFWLFDGHDTVRAGGGNDFVESSAGSNALAGGPGRDLVLYLDGKDLDHQHHAVTVNLRAGVSSSGDTLSAFEDVLGSPKGDILIGTERPNRLYGWLGDDILEGRSGDDALVGQDGVDRANGGAGTDRCPAEAKKNCEPVSRRVRGSGSAFNPSIADRMFWFLGGRNDGRWLDRSTRAGAA